MVLTECIRGRGRGRGKELVGAWVGPGAIVITGMEWLTWPG